MGYKIKGKKLDSKHEIRFPKEFAKKFILEFTKKGDFILDPFAGFGTTLFAAQDNGRIGIGIEYNSKRCDYIKKRLKLPGRIINGDSTKLDSINLPKMDFLLTSPPYMRYFDKENPLSNYTKKGNYKNYLTGIGKIFSKIKKVMKRNSFIVVEASNTFGKSQLMTPLAWDLGKEISKYFFLEREIVYCHKEKDSSSNGKNHSYCLIFRNK